MVNKDRIKEKLSSLESQLKSLREKQKISLREYQNDGDLQALVERRLQNAIQACIDIGMHVVSEEGPRKPETYADIFTVLEEMDILHGELASKLREKAGFRNVLAHEYAGIINEKVYDQLHALETFEEFAEIVTEKYL